MAKNYLNVADVSLPEVIADWKRKYPHHSYETLNGTKMRQILVGELVMVKISGKKKYELWLQTDIDSGKLATEDAKRRQVNQQMRRLARGW